jgi:diguanylate cyclase (GGDEF)-like protein
MPIPWKWKADSFTRKRLIRIITILLIVMILLTSLLSVAITRQAINQDIRNRDLPLISEEVYAAVEDNLTRAVLNTSFMANDIFLQDWILDGETDPDVVAYYLKNIQDKNPYSSAFFISNITQNYYNHEGVLRKIDPRKTKDAWFRFLQFKEADYILHVDKDEAARRDELAVLVVHRVRNQNDTYLGATGVALPLDPTINAIKSFQKQHDCLIYMINSNGLIEIHADPAVIGQTYIQNLAGVGDHSHEILANRIGTNLFQYQINQRDIAVASRYFPNLDWYVVIEQDQTAALAEARKTLLLNSAFGIALVALIVFSVISTVNLFQSKLEAMAIIDELTGLFNRRRFYNLFQREIAYAKRYEQPLSLLMVDIDHFKKVNDQYGHPAGDRVLKKAAELMRQEVRAVDVVGRWGGEEFVILLHKTDPQQAFVTAERLRESIAAAEFDTGKKIIHVTISLGIAGADYCNLDMEEMIKQADQAMYRAKQEGRNRTCIMAAPPSVEECGSTESKSTPPPGPIVES